MFCFHFNNFLEGKKMTASKKKSRIINLSDSLYEDYLSDSENEDDLSGGLGINISQAVVSATDWTTETILNQIKKKNIILNPKFQRREAWDDKRKSKFIESLFLGLPIPQIVLAEDKKRKGAYLVIDGKQRLLSIRRFISQQNDEEYQSFRLKGLTIREDLNGRSYEDIKEDLDLFEDISSFENQSIRTIVIKNWPNENFLYHVFLRLNTGSVPLSPQELRQALHPGPFLDYIDEVSDKSLAIRSILGIKKPDYRMRDIELLVRFFSFKNFLSVYSGNLKLFLDETCKKLNDDWDYYSVTIEQQFHDFENAYTTICQIFTEENAFRKWEGSEYQSRFNRAIFDVMFFYFSDPKVCQAVKQKESDIENEFKKLCENNRDFMTSLEHTTKSVKAIHTRFSCWADLLNRVLGLDLYIFSIKNNKLV